MIVEVSYILHARCKKNKLFTMVFDYVVVVCDISNELFGVDVVVINCGGERALKPILPGQPNVKIGR